MTEFAIKNQEKINELAKKHCIWIRDDYFKEFRFQHGMPWPLAQIMGKAFPIFSFIEAFNEQYALEGFNNASTMDHNVQARLLQDYFVEGEEGFSFPIDEAILEDEGKFNECLKKLYEKFPHLLEEAVAV